MLSSTLVRQPPQIMSNALFCAQGPSARHILRGADDAIALAGNALGFLLPTQPYGSAIHGDRAALWLGPQELLLLAPDDQADELAKLLRESLFSAPHSLVDVSHRQTGLEIKGPHAEALLSAGCPLHLHVDVFRVGACTRTVFGKAEIILWRRDIESFHVEVWRSLAAYVTQLLVEASRDSELQR